MKRYLFVFAFTIFYTLQGSSNPTAFDTSFNGIGYVEQSLGATSSASQDEVLMQDDGKIISIGTTSDTTPRSILIARYLSDGTLDQTYGTGGITTQNFGYNTYAYAAAIQTDGKVVVVGLVSSPQTNFVTARFTTDGLLDSYANNTVDPFGSATPTSALGYVTNFAPDTGYNAATGITIDSTSGDIFVSGYAILTSNGYREIFLYSYATNGTLNTSTFGSPNGYVLTSAPAGYLQTTGASPAIQSDGSIIVAGSVCEFASLTGSTLQLALFRYLANGSVDTTLGDGNGYVIFNQFPNYPYSAGHNIVLQTNGRILVSGFAISTSGNQQIMTTRYLINGTIDTSFNTTGYHVTTIPESVSSTGQKVLLEPSGKIVTGGYATLAESINNILLIRYNPNGTLDTDLNGSGYMLSTIDDYSTTLRSHAIQSDAKLVVVAQFNNGTNQIMATIRYLGGNILEPTTTAIGKYGTSSTLFQEFLYVNFYAQIITDVTAQTATISDVNDLLAQYTTDYINQPNFNFLLYLYLLEEELIEMEASLISEYGDVGISQFFSYLNERFTQVSMAN